MTGFLIGLRAPWTGLRQIGQPGLRRYLLAPLAINITLFIAAMAWMLDTLDATLRDGLPAWAAGIVYLALAFALGLLTLWVTTMLANLLASPFNYRLAMRMEALLGNPPPDIQSPLWKEALLTLRGEGRRLLHLLFWVILLLVLGFVPLLNLLAPIGWLMLGAWLMALQYMDYPLGLRGHGFAAQRALLGGGRLGFSMGFGLSAQLMHLLPGINLLAMPASVAGACLGWNRLGRSRPGGRGTLLEP